MLSSGWTAGNGDLVDDEAGPEPSARRHRRRRRGRMMDPPRQLEDLTVSVTSPDPRSAVHPEWERRFRAPAILFSEIAIDAPEIGLVSSNATGVPQLYRWDTSRTR